MLGVLGVNYNKWMERACFFPTGGLYVSPLHSKMAPERHPLGQATVIENRSSLVSRLNLIDLMILYIPDN